VIAPSGFEIIFHHTKLGSGMHIDLILANEPIPVPSFDHGRNGACFHFRQKPMNKGYGLRVGEWIMG